jgi:hypothetical protein
MTGTEIWCPKSFFFFLPFWAKLDEGVGFGAGKGQGGGMRPYFFKIKTDEIATISKLQRFRAFLSLSRRFRNVSRRFSRRRETSRKSSRNVAKRSQNHRDFGIWQGGRGGGGNPNSLIGNGGIPTPEPQNCDVSRRFSRRRETSQKSSRKRSVAKRRNSGGGGVIMGQLGNIPIFPINGIFRAGHASPENPMFSPQLHYCNWGSDRIRTGYFPVLIRS